jgi:GAF domain-containing protein
MMPDLSILSEMISISNRWGQTRQPPAQLLEAVLPVLVKVVPEVSALRLYHFAGNQLIPVAATDQDLPAGPPPLSSDDTFLYNQVPEADPVLLDEGQPRWGAGLRWDDRLWFILEIITDPQQTPTANGEDWLAFLVTQLAATLQSQASHNRFQRYTLAVNELVAGQSLAEMAQIIARHMLPQKGRLLTLGRLAYDDQARITGWELLVTANRNGLYDLGDTFLPWHEVGPAIQYSVLDDEPFVLNDCDAADPEEIGPVFYERLQTTESKAYLNVPFLLADQSNISLSVLSKDRQVFPPEEVEAFRAVASLVGALIDVSRLGGQTERALAVVDNLVLANRLIATAASSAYMAQAVIYTLGQDLAAIAITLFDRPLDLADPPETHNLVAFSTQAEVVELETALRIDIPSSETIQALHSGLPVTYSGEDTTRYITTGMKSYLDGQEVAWIGLFGMRSGNQLLGTLILADISTHVLSEAETNAYTTLADQVGVVLQSRELLQSSREAHALTEQLVDTNRAISAAIGHDEMAQVILRSLPEPVTLSALLLFDTPMVEKVLPASVTTSVVATREALLHPEIADELDPDHPRFQSVTRRLLAGEPVQVSDTRAIDPFMPKATAYLAEELGTYNFTIAGLLHGERLLGMLLIGMIENASLSDVQMANLTAIADQTAITIENRNLFNQTAGALGFVHAQFETTSAIYHADNPVQMLQAIYHFATFSNSNFNRAEMVFLEDPADEDGDTVLRVVAEVRAGEARAATYTISASDLVGIDEHHLTVPKPVIVFDVAQDKMVSATDRKRLLEKNVAAMLILPLLTSGQRLLGMIHITGSHPVEIALDRMRALNTLVEQVAVVLENRDLLRQTESSLQEARTLYNTNRDLLEAQDAMGVLTALQRHLAPDTLSISLFRVNWNESATEIDSVVLEGFLSDTVKQTDQADLNAMVTQGEKIELIDDIEALLKTRPELAYFSDQGARSLAIFPIQEEGRLLSQVNIAYRSERTFDTRTRRLFDAIRDQVTVVLQNQQLLRDTRTFAANLSNQVRVLQTLNQLAATLSATQDEQTLMDTTCEALHTALRGDHISLALLNLDGQSSKVVSEYPKRGAVGTGISAENPIQTRLREAHRSITITNQTAEPDQLQAARGLVGNLGMNALLLLPLLDTRAGYIGSISMGVEREGYTFTEDQIDIARTITSQIAVSLQNIRLLQSTQHQATQLEQIATFSRAVQQTLDVAELLEIGLTNIGRIISADHMSVLINDTLTNRLRMVAWKEDTDEVQVNMQGGPVVDLEGTTAGRVWESKQSIFITDLQAEKDLTFTHRDDVRTVMASPIRTRGVIIGIIELGHTRPDAYQTMDNTVFRQIVNQLAVAIENAESYAQSQRLAKSKALVNEISSQLQRQTEIDRLLGVTMHELGKALGARRARIRLSADAISEDVERE